MNFNKINKLKKIIGTVILSALLFLQTGVFADINLSGGDFTVTNADNTVTVNGVTSTKEKDTDVSILVTKSDINRTDITAENAPAALVFADQIKTDAGGVYSYNFKLGEEYGTYTVNIYDSSDQSIKSKDVIYQKPSINRPNGLEIKFLNTATNEEIYYLTKSTNQVKINITIDQDNDLNLNNGAKPVFAAAAYKNNRLIEVLIINAKAGVTEEGLNTAGADYVKVFGWQDINSLTPIMTECVLMQYEKLLPEQVMFDGKAGVGTVTGMTKNGNGEYRLDTKNVGEIVLSDSSDDTPADGAVISFDFKTDSADSSAYFSFVSKKADGSERTTNNLIVRNQRTDVENEVISPVLQVFKNDQRNTLDDTYVYGKNQAGSDYMYRDYGVDLLESDTETSDKAGDNSYKKLLHKKIEITPNNWHHIDICIDYAYGSENGYGSDGTYGRSFVYYYMDGKLLKQAEYWDYYNSPGDMRYSQNPSWAIQDIRSGLKKLKSVKITNRGTDGMEFKDVKVRKITNYGETLTFDNDLEYPYYFDKWISLKNSCVGSNFVGKNINYTAEITNPYLTDGKFTYSLKVINTDTNTVEQTINDGFNLIKGETKSVPIAFTAERYGRYKITGSATDNLTGRVINIENEFTVSVKNESYNPKMMFCDHMTVHYMGTRDAGARLKYLSDIGISGIREDQPYLKTAGGLHDGAKLVFDETKNNNMDRIVILTGNLWNSPIASAEDLAAFKADITKVINATKGYAVAYEVYNEYNLHETATTYTPAQYVEILKIAHETVEQYNPGAKVYGIGSATNMWKGEVSHKNYLTFTEECLKLGAAHYCDGFALHPYGGGYTSVTQTYESLIPTIVDVYKNTRCQCSACENAGKNTYDIEKKDVVITELGYSSSDDNRQTAMVLGYLNLIGDEVDRVSLYVDMMKESTSEDQKYYGMTATNHIQYNYPKEPYRARNSMIALAAFNDLSRGSFDKTITNVSNDNDLKLVKSKYDSGESLIAFFDTKLNGDSLANRNVSVKLKFNNVSADGVKLYDSYGNETVYKAENGQLTLDVVFEAQPKYIKGDFDVSAAIN